jgi:hypothetical protein
MHHLRASLDRVAGGPALPANPDWLVQADLGVEYHDPALMQPHHDQLVIYLPRAA